MANVKVKRHAKLGIVYLLAPAANDGKNKNREELYMSMVFCSGCGKEMHADAKSCPHCGLSKSRPGQGKNKVVAGVLALFLGGLGIHRFYLGQWWGLFYLLFVWTFIPSIIAFIEGIVFFVTNDDSWEEKYGKS